MFARQSSRASTCLRCQYRALLGLELPQYSRSRVPLSSFHTSRPTSDEAQPNSDNSPTRTQIGPLARRSGYKFKSVYIRGKLRGRKGREVREDAAALPVNTLGQPAEVIILRDASVEQNEDAQEPSADVTPSTSPSLTREEILASLEESYKIDFKTPLDQRILSFKPLSSRRNDSESGSILSRQEYEELEKTIKDGFTIAQLNGFVKRHTPTPEPLPAGPRLLHVKHWRPGTSSTTVKLPEVEALPAHGKSRKSKAVTSLLQRLWHIDIAEDVNVVGQLEFQVDSGLSSLLNANHMGRLHDIASRNQVRVEVTDGDNRIRITAVKEPAMRAFREIQDICRSTIVQTTHVRNFLSHVPAARRHEIIKSLTEWPLDKEDVATAASLSNTAIEWNSDNSKKQVKIVAANTGDLQEADRLLRALCLIRSESRPKVLLKQKALDDAVPQLSAHLASLNISLRKQSPVRLRTALVRCRELSQHPRADGDLSQKDGAEASLARKAASPPRKAATTSPTVGELIDSLQVPTHPQTTSDSKQQSTGASLWEQPPQDIISASVGNALIPQLERAGAKRKPGDCLRNIMKAGGWFVDVVPGLHQLLPSLEGYDAQQIDRRNSLVFRLAPDHFPSKLRGVDSFPKVKGTVANALPDIFVELLVGGSSAVASGGPRPTVTAVLRQKSALVMLPHLSTDLKFNRTIYQRQKVGDELGLGASLQEWIMKAQEMIARGGHVRVHAPTVDVDLNARPLLSGLPGLKEATIEELAKTPLTVPYLFTTVEYRQSVALRFGGRELVLTSREGGKLGGRGFELSLRSPSLASCANKRRAQEEQFYRTAYQLAQVVDDAVHGRLAGRQKAGGTEQVLKESPNSPPSASDSESDASNWTGLFEEDNTVRQAAAG